MSEDNLGSETPELYIKIENSLLQVYQVGIDQALKSTEYLLDTEVIEEIRVKIEEIMDEDTIIKSMDYFLFTLINKMQLLAQRTHKM